MKVFNEEIINEFSEPCPIDVATNVLDWAEDVLTEVIEDIRKKNPVVTSDYSFMLGGEFSTGATTVNSEIDLYICFKSPQLELNTMKLVNNKFIRFWNKIKFSWKGVLADKKSKRRKKKEQEKIKAKQEVIIPINKFSIANLKSAIVKNLLKYIDTTSYIFVTNNGFKIVAREHLGIDINVFPVISSLDMFKLYNDYTNKFFEFNFGEKEQNIKEKIEKIGEIFILLLRVYNNLFFNIFGQHANQSLIESLLYNVPNELFYGDSFYEIFLKTFNYLKNININNFVSINNTEKKIFSEKLIGESIVHVNNFFKHIEKMM